MRARPRPISPFLLPVLCASVLCASLLCVLALPAVAAAQTSGGGVGVGGASGAAGRYIDPGMNAGITSGVTAGTTTTTVSGFSASTGVTGTSGGSGTSGGDGDLDWRGLLVVGIMFLIFAAGGAVLSVAGDVAYSVRRWRARRRS